VRPMQTQPRAARTSTQITSAENKKNIPTITLELVFTLQKALVNKCGVFRYVSNSYSFAIMSD
jgi:hypothetical protein